MSNFGGAVHFAGTYPKAHQVARICLNRIPQGNMLQGLCWASNKKPKQRFLFSESFGVGL